MTGRLAILPAPDQGASDGASARLVESRILEHRPIGDRYWFLRLDAPAIAQNAQPGQFVMLTVARRDEPGPVLPRPMAIFDCDRDLGHVDIVYGVVGGGTRRLSTFAVAERITTLGPLGRGFVLSPTTSRILLVGRGIGTCSLTALALQADARRVSVAAVDSARTREALIGGTAYTGVHAQPLIQVTDEEGSSRPVDVERRLVEALDLAPPQQIFSCGSQRLTDLAGRLALRWGGELQVSVEAHMACGLGYCHGCSTGQRSAEAEAPLVCQDGPVFKWLAADAG